MVFVGYLDTFDIYLLLLLLLYINDQIYSNFFVVDVPSYFPFYCVLINPSRINSMQVEQFRK